MDYRVPEVPLAEWVVPRLVIGTGGESLQGSNRGFSETRATASHKLLNVLYHEEYVAYALSYEIFYSRAQLLFYVLGNLILCYFKQNLELPHKKIIDRLLVGRSRQFKTMLYVNVDRLLTQANKIPK